MSFKFKEVDIKKDFTKTINLVGKIEDKSEYLLVTLDNGIIIQADSYSEIGSITEEALRMSFGEPINSVKTHIITEDFFVIEIKIIEE